MREISVEKTDEVTALTDPRDAEAREMLRAVLRSLVDEADQVELVSVAGDGGAAFQVRCAAADVGKLIGKSGRTARAIRTILTASAAKCGRRYSLDISQ